MLFHKKLNLFCSYPFQHQYMGEGNATFFLLDFKELKECFRKLNADKLVMEFFEKGSNLRLLSYILEKEKQNKNKTKQTNTY